MATSHNNIYNTSAYAEKYLSTRWPQAIWRAVLEQAINDIISGSEDFRAAAQDWVADTVDEARRFEWVCEHLGLEPSAVRREIERRLSEAKL